jgi:mono/diheme cytochrome c family protein
MRFSCSLRLVPRTLLVLLFAAGPAVAQQNNDAGTTSVLHGAYTAEQAARGEALFGQHCVECHIARQFTGSAFMRAWQGRRVFDLFDLIRTTMPMTNPGRLARPVYADIVAYLLQLNELPAGDEPLPGDDEALTRILMPPRP